jgi:hypothetical protein
MRSRPLALAGVGVAALAVGVALAAPANGAGHPVGVAFGSSASDSHAASAHSTAASCYAQLDNDNGVGIVSQNFEPSLDAYDSQGADDFTLTKKCKVKTVSAAGAYFNGSGPADSFNVFFYDSISSRDGGLEMAARGKLPDKTCLDATYTDSSGTGNPTIKCKTKLTASPSKKRTFWVSIQANMSFGTGGEWGWNTNNTVRGSASLWQNPGDGFATGCTTYTTTTTCLPLGEGGDFSFALN